MINPRSRRYNITAYTMILLAVVLWDTSLVAAPYFAYVGGIIGAVLLKDKELSE